MSDSVYLDGKLKADPFRSILFRFSVHATMAVRCGTSKTLSAISFNQDGSCVVACTHKGIRIFSTESYELVRDLGLGPTTIAAMLYCTGFLAFTGTGEKSSPRQVTLYNSVTRSVIRNILLPTTVLNLGLNRQYMAVVLEQKTMIYTLGENVDLLCSIPTSPNPRGVAALSLTPQSSVSPSAPNSSKVLLAVPGDHAKGIIHVHNISQKGEGTVLEVDAHETSLSFLSFSPDGKNLASASVKGTVIRVFDAVQGTKLFTLRRGTTPARITSIAFSPPRKGSPSLLCVASERGSVHVFRLMDTSARHPARSVARTMFSAMVHKPPTCYGDRIAKIELPCKPGTAAVCIFRSLPKSDLAVESRNENIEEQEELKIQVATGEGILYQYSIIDVTGKGAAQTSLEGQWVFA